MASTWEELVSTENFLVGFADHEGEDEGGGGGLDDPEGDQGGRLDPSEQVHLQKAVQVQKAIWETQDSSFSLFGTL